MSSITFNQLREYLEYNPETGIFIWRVDRRGKIAGGLDNLRYRITLNNRCYKAHRLAWFYMNHEWPTKQIDHI